MFKHKKTHSFNQSFEREFRFHQISFKIFSVLIGLAVISIFGLAVLGALGVIPVPDYNSDYDSEYDNPRCNFISFRNSHQMYCRRHQYHRHYYNATPEAEE
jgi:hypothetical protein